MNKQMFEELGINVELQRQKVFNYPTLVVMGLVIVLMVLSFIISYHSQQAFALLLGFTPSSAQLLPLVIDGAVVVFSTVAVVSQLNSQEKWVKRAKYGMWGYAGFSALVNIAEGWARLTNTPNFSVAQMDTLSAVLTSEFFLVMLGSALFVLAPVSLALLVEFLIGQLEVALQSQKRNELKTVNELTNVMTDLVAQLKSEKTDREQLVTNMQNLEGKLTDYDQMMTVLNGLYRDVIKYKAGIYNGSQDSIAAEHGISKGKVNKLINGEMFMN